MLKIDNNIIKLVVCDIDGTVAFKEQTINRFVSPEVVNTIKQLREEKIYFVFNTGNSYITIDKIIELFNAKESQYTKYFVGVNGNCLYDFSKEKAYLKKILPKKLVKEIQVSVRQYSTAIMVMNEIASKIYISNELQKVKFEENINDEKEEKIRLVKSTSMPPNSAQVSIQLSKPEYKNEVKSILKKYEHEIDISWWSEHGLDINAKNINKFNGLKDIVEMINKNENENITLDNVIYFGDQNNDISVFKNHKYAIAMGNAIDEIKSYAFDVTDAVHENGFPNYIKKITV